MHNVKVAFRRIVGSPFVSLVAVLSLALGIGANSAIFTLFDRMLLQSLPVPAPHELVNLEAPGPKPGSQSCNQSGRCDVVFSYPMFRDLEDQQRVFTGIAAYRSFPANLASGGETLRSAGLLVSGSYFSVLGLNPAAGRLLGPEDDRALGAHFVVVVSHAYWMSRFGGERGVVDQTIVINGHPMRVIGVAPEGFKGTTLGAPASLFVPISMRGLMQPGWEGFDNRRSYWAYLFARRAPGIEIERANEAINVSYAAIVNQVEAPLQVEMTDATMARFKAKKVVLLSGRRGQSTLHREASAPLILLLSVTGVVLLIACANIANLLLARAAGRAAELAVRLSIGASRRQIVGQLLTESVLLGLLGGAFGLLVARATLLFVLTKLPEEAASYIEGGLDLRMILFTGLVAIGTGVLFGLYPALHSTRPDLVSAIRSQAGMASGSRNAGRFRSALAMGQIALSVTLLIAAGLFVKSLNNVTRIELGLDTERLVTFSISPELNSHSVPQSLAMFARVEEALNALGEVSDVTASLVPLISGDSWGNNVVVQGHEKGPDEDSNSRFNAVGTNFFRAIGTPLIAGREFADSDTSDSPKVAIVNQTFTKMFGLEQPVGMWMRAGGPEELKTFDTQIVGVVQDSKYSDVKRPAPPLFFRPYRQIDYAGWMYFYVRTASPDSTFAAIRQIVRRLDPNLPIVEMRTMHDQIEETLLTDQLTSTLSAAFAILATLLAAVGLYGVISYTIAQRTREFGLRMALGADRASVRRQVMAHVSRMTVLGGLAGLLAALVLGRLTGSMLYELEAHDPAIMMGSALLMMLVAAIAGWIPAERAARINPIVALRHD